MDNKFVEKMQIRFINPDTDQYDEVPRWGDIIDVVYVNNDICLNCPNRRTGQVCNCILSNQVTY